MIEKVIKEIKIEDYKRAEEFLPWNIHQEVFNANIEPHWIENGKKFWYVRKLKNEKKFLLVNPELNEKRNAFDHAKLAQALSEITGKTINPDKLPFDFIEFFDEGRSIQFNIKKKRWICDLESYHCKKIKKKKEFPLEWLVSPDQRWAAYVKENNIVIQSITTGEEYNLTNDGKQYYGYGILPDSNTFGVTIRRIGISLAPIAKWSPDSKKLLVCRLDQRSVKELNLLQSVPQGGYGRPKLHSYKYPMVGDEDLGLSELFILDVEKKEKIKVNYDAFPTSILSPIEANFTWWGKDGKYVYYLYLDRYFKEIKFIEVDAETGNARVVIQESRDTHIDLNLYYANTPNVRVLSNSKEVIWFSERDGWAHLYLYDLETGLLKNQITKGLWVVRDILHIDELNRKIYFLACGREVGRDPYYRHLYRLNLDGKNLQLLTPENADHDVLFSKAGEFFIDVYSRVDQPPITKLCSEDGHLIFELERSDIDLIFKKGWKPPKSFTVKAADNVTDIYGVIYFPSKFDPKKIYPVIDSIYPGPQVIRTPKSFPRKLNTDYLWFWEPQALAELGFLVITIDGRGTPFRSKEFHDFSYNNLGSAGCLVDHISAIKQLAYEFPYIDLERVGIFGDSGGGFASTRAILEYPDFFKVAVSGAGDHDMRFYVAGWGEKFQGKLESQNYLNLVNARLVKNLKGKLLLVHGDLDDNVHPALTIQLMNGLINNNKDFDFLLLPNNNHFIGTNGYFIRKRWDYFVEHLLGVKPPKEYLVKSPNFEITLKIYMNF
ncbi:MAG: DPP IV N-terminal domain-containing protein [Candidatus Hodarchaeota archaeon]